jgi:NAD(P)-dependent dehydrogenase (short-subunit alcohol dehydrogenase family)
MKDTQGRVAFVTGGGSGLGIARAFVSAGMKVMLADLRTDHLRAAVESFAGLSAADYVRSVQVDVADRDGMAEAARHTESVFGPIHVLVNNAGVAIEVPIAETTYADWDYGLDVIWAASSTAANLPPVHSAPWAMGTSSTPHPWRRSW